MSTVDDQRTLRAFYMSCIAPAWVDIARSLESRYGLTPVYWSAHPNVATQVRHAFPNAIFHDRLDAARGIPPVDLPFEPDAPLDHSMLHSLAPVEAEALKMMDRMDAGDALPYRIRISLYHRLVTYWTAALRELRPDILIFLSAPHFVYDYVAYRLAKRSGVATLIFRHTSLPDLSFPASSIESGHEPIVETYQQALGEYAGRDVTLSDANEAYLAQLRGSYEDGEPAYMKRQRERGAIFNIRTLATRGLGALPGVFARSGRYALDVLRAARAETIVVTRDAGLSEYPTKLAYLSVKAKAGLRQRRLKRLYQRLAVQPDLSKPYVFLALHFQPERTTSPDAGVFVHQQLIIEQLARHLPEGWRLYVKEHPTQFAPDWLFDSVSAYQRSASFYREVATRSDVQFVDLTFDPFELIKHAKAVATATGTVGWEAVVRERPVLAFGYPWYLGCDSVFHVMDEHQLQQALETIEAGHEVNAEHTRIFVRVLEGYGFLRNQDSQPDVEAIADESSAVIVQRWSDAIGEFMRHSGLCATRTDTSNAVAQGGRSA